MLSFIFEYGASLFDAVLVVWFVTRFTGKSFKVKSNPYWIPAAAIIFIYTIISDKFLSGFNVLSTCIFLALYIAYGLISAWDEKVRAIFSAIAFEIMIILFSTLLYFVMSFAFSNFDTLMQGSDTYVRYIHLLIHKVLLFTFCNVLLIAFRREKRMSVSNSILTASFSAFTMAGLAVSMTVSTRSTDRTVQIAAFATTLIFVVSNAFLYFLIFKIIKLQESKFRLELVQSKLEFEKETYENAKVIWDEARELRHDIKQHLTVIDGYLQEGSYSECRDYVSKLLSAAERPKNAVIRSDNKVIDYIINSKLGKRTDIDLLVSGTIGDMSDIEEQDLVSLLGNLIDNAIEAVSGCERRTIELIFFMQNSDRCVICKNSVAGSVLANNRELRTTKRDGKRHGLGTSIVRRIIEKYHGMIDYYEEDTPAGKLFCAQLLLPVNKTTSAE